MNPVDGPYYIFHDGLHDDPVFVCDFSKTFQIWFGGKWVPFTPFKFELASKHNFSDLISMYTHLLT